MGDRVGERAGTIALAKPKSHLRRIIALKFALKLCGAAINH
jgi:hypothetical protein